MTQNSGHTDTVNERLVLVFRSSEDYIFAVGDSTNTLIVRLSSEAIGLFKSHGIGADDLARLAARWAHGCRRTSVDLALTGKDFPELYLAVFPSLEDGLRQVAEPDRLSANHSPKDESWRGRDALTKKDDRIESKHGKTAERFRHKTKLFPADIVHCGAFSSYLLRGSLPV